MISDGLWFYVFLPYSVTWGLTAMVGWDLLAYVMLFAGFLFMTVVFYPVGAYLVVDRKSPEG